ncbi:MAG: MoaD/ThiS family protein, partial [Nitrososphaerota archaeon]
MTSTLAMYLKSDQELHLEVSSIRDLLNQLSEKFGDAFRQRVLDERGNLRSFVVLYVNGKNIQLTEGLDTRLEDGD